MRAAPATRVLVVLVVLVPLTRRLQVPFDMTVPQIYESIFIFADWVTDSLYLRKRPSTSRPGRCC